MIRWTMLCLMAAFAMFLGGKAVAEDGAPTTPKPTSCVDENLTGGQDYSSPYSVDVAECIDGGDGSNTIYVLGGRDWVNGKDGTDPIRGGDDGDTIWGGKEGDALYGDAGDDYIYAGCPNGCVGGQGGATYVNFLHGDGGEDVLAMANNVPNDKADCGSGVDKVYMDKSDTAQSDCEWKIKQ